MPLPETLRRRQIGAAAGWRAELRLGFERREQRTVLAGRQHQGPFLVQKALYPEGAHRCHAILLHPPGGLVGGDSILLQAAIGSRAAALLTTPGATKFYRSEAAAARTETRLSVEPLACLEWLPREAIVFNGARAHSRLRLELAQDARCLGWELWCLGRTASGERFRSGRLQIETRFRIAGRVCWEERGVLEGGAGLLHSAAGFSGQPVFATLWAVGPVVTAPLLDACRAVRPTAGRGALTQLPQVLIARYLGASTEDAFTWLTTLWTLLRPHYAGCDAVRPRIWAT